MVDDSVPLTAWDILGLAAPERADVEEADEQFLLLLTALRRAWGSVVDESTPHVDLWMGAKDIARPLDR